MKLNSEVRNDRNKILNKFQIKLNIHHNSKLNEKCNSNFKIQQNILPKRTKKKKRSMHVYKSVLNVLELSFQTLLVIQI